MCLKGKEHHDLKYGIPDKKLAVGSIVLLHDTRHKKNMSRKLTFKWLGPYKIYNAVKDKSMYMVKKLNRSRLAGTFARDKFQKFHPRQKPHLDQTPDLTYKVVPTLKDFLADNGDKLFDIPDDFYDA